MVDFTGSLAPYMYEVLRGDIDREANKRHWNRRLRELRAKDHAKDRGETTIIVVKPDNLAGPHKF